MADEIRAERDLLIRDILTRKQRNEFDGLFGPPFYQGAKNSDISASGKSFHKSPGLKPKTKQGKR